MIAPPTAGAERRLSALASLAAACAALAWGCHREGPSGTGADRLAWQPPEPAPLAAMAWPAAIPPGARAAFERAVREAGAGQDAAADASMAAAIEAMTAAGVAPTDAMGAHHLQLVTRAIVEKNAAAAERRALRWLGLAPGDVHHRFLLGQIRYQERRWSGAAECFRELVAARPGWVDAHRWLAQTCSQLGAQDAGVAAVRASLDLVGFPEGQYWTHPLGEKVLGNAIAVLHRFQQYELLQAVAAAYCERFAARHEAVMAHGVALANLGRHAEAEPLLRRALAEPGNHANADEISFELALCLTRSGRWTEAARFLAGLLERNPYHAKAYHQLALACDRLGRAADAAAMRDKARELAPSERELRREKELRSAGHAGKGAAAASRGYALRGEFRRAEQALRTAELRSDPFAVFALADFYITALRVEDGEAVLEHAAALVGAEHPDVSGRRGLCFLAKGDAERGWASLRAASRAGADSVWKMELARELVRAGRGAEAASILAPLRRGDEDREASYWLGRALVDGGDAARAAGLFRSISTADTRYEDWEASVWLALAELSAGGNRDDAGRLLEAVPETGRASRAYLRARVKLLESAGTGDPGRAAATQALARHEAADSSVAALRMQVALAPSAESGGLRLALARLYAGRGEILEAQRQALLVVAVLPDSLEAWRLLSGWLTRDADAFLRLRAAREALRLAPADAGLQAQTQELAARWLQ